MYKKLIGINKTLICAALCYSLIMLGIVPVSAQTLPTGANNPSFPQLDAKVQEIKNQIIKIGQNNDITIFGRKDRIFHGSVLEIKDESVSINEIDQKVIVEIKYQDIKKIRNDYGFGRSRTGRQRSTRKNIIAIVALVGIAVVLPFILVASAKD